MTAQDRAILQLKQQRDRIRIFQRKTQADIDKHKDLALKLFQQGMTERALIIMRRRKTMENILDRTDKQLATLEELANDIEYKEIEISVVEGLKVGTQALKQLNSLIDIEDIEQMMESNKEAAEKQREISEILSRSQERYDEAELLEELEGYKPKEVAKDPVPQEQAETEQAETGQIGKQMEPEQGDSEQAESGEKETVQMETEAAPEENKKKKKERQLVMA